MTAYDALQVAFQEDEQVLPLAVALEALPGIHAVRWCGGHNPANLENLTWASGTRYEGMTHPPEEPHAFWIEAMCLHAISALDSLYTVTAALETEDDYDTTLTISSPWEGITLTIAGLYATRTPTELAELITETAAEIDWDDKWSTPEQITASVLRRVSGFTQRGALDVRPPRSLP